MEYLTNYTYDEIVIGQEASLQLHLRKRIFYYLLRSLATLILWI